jgi:transcriptional regulator with XRE-family HTH domain
MSARKMTDEQADQVRALRAEGWTYRQLSDRFGIAESTLGCYLKGHHAKAQGVSLRRLQPPADWPVDALFGGRPVSDRYDVFDAVDARDAANEGPDGYFPWERR